MYSHRHQHELTHASTHGVAGALRTPPQPDQSTTIHFMQVKLSEHHYRPTSDNRPSPGYVVVQDDHQGCSLGCLTSMQPASTASSTPSPSGDSSKIHVNGQPDQSKQVCFGEDNIDLTTDSCYPLTLKKPTPQYTTSSRRSGKEPVKKSIV